MTVRCDVCGTENRDKAMFCRGCAGKLPAFAPTGRPAIDGHHARNADPAAEAGSTRPRPSDVGDRSSWTARTRLVLASLLVAAVLGTSAWLLLAPAGMEGPPAPIDPPAISSQLPPEDSLASGESLEGGAAVLPQVPDPSPATTPPAPPGPPPAAQEPAVAGTDPPATPRNTGRRPATETRSTTRARDPRAGCEHLFFAFAARCEANHCQQAAYARHPRCDAVREQRRLDDARRNSMPTS